MFEKNFWMWLLLGVNDLLLALLQPMPLYLPHGLVEYTITVVFYAALLLIVVFGSFVHLNVFIAVLGVVMIMEPARVGFAIWRWIKTFIPLP